MNFGRRVRRQWRRLKNAWRSQRDYDYEPIDYGDTE